ncbi:MAG: hypothetical protein GY953_36845 [bacterium]|nr:hypothetical protein [bacterium]
MQPRDNQDVIALAALVVLLLFHPVDAVGLRHAFIDAASAAVELRVPNGCDISADIGELVNKITSRH